MRRTQFGCSMHQLCMHAAIMTFFHLIRAHKVFFAYNESNHRNACQNAWNSWTKFQLQLYEYSIFLPHLNCSSQQQTVICWVTQTKKNKKVESRANILRSTYRNNCNNPSFDSFPLQLHEYSIFLPQLNCNIQRQSTFIVSEQCFNFKLQTLAPYSFIDHNKGECDDPIHAWLRMALLP